MKTFFVLFHNSHHLSILIRKMTSDANKHIQIDFNKRLIKSKMSVIANLGSKNLKNY